MLDARCSTVDNNSISMSMSVLGLQVSRERMNNSDRMLANHFIILLKCQSSGNVYWTRGCLARNGESGREWKEKKRQTMLLALIICGIGRI